MDGIVLKECACDTESQWVGPTRLQMSGCFYLSTQTGFKHLMLTCDIQVAQASNMQTKTM